MTMWETLLPGSKARRSLPVEDGPELPLWLVRGGEEGPTLAVTAGVHGCEYAGIQAVRRLYEGVEPGALRGRLLLLPLANPGGFYAGARQLVPDCGRNLNRAFPGDPAGDTAARIAAAIRQTVYPQAELLLDLHGGDIHERLTPLLFYPRAGSEEVNRRSLAAARVMPLPIRVGSVSKNGLYSCAVQQGVPALLLEAGDGGDCREEAVSLLLEGIRAAMGFLGIAGAAAENPCQRESLETVYVQAEQAGLWQPQVWAGQSFCRGQLLGTLTSLEGETLQRVEAPFHGRMLYHTRILGVSRGEELAAFGRLA